MSVHGSSVDFVAGPPSQPPTTRTTPDSGLGGDDRNNMRVPPPGFNMTHAAAMYPSMMPGHPDHYNGPHGDFKHYNRNGTTYFEVPNAQAMSQDAYNRMQGPRGQQAPPMSYTDENYGHSSTPSQSEYYSGSSTNANFAGGTAMHMHPGAVMVNPPASMPHQSSHFWDNSHVPTTPPVPFHPTNVSNGSMTSGYDGELNSQMTMTGSHHQQWGAPQNFHQPPPVTPNGMYHQQQPGYMPNGAPSNSPVIVQQLPMFVPPSYHSQMVQGHPGMMQQPMLFAHTGAPLMMRQGGGARFQEQQQFIPPGIVPPYYASVPPPMVYPVMGFNPNIPRRSGYNGNRRGFSNLNGRGRHIPGGVQSEPRPESVRSDANTAADGTEDLNESVAELQLKETVSDRDQRQPASPGYPTEYSSKRQSNPPKQILQLAADVKPDRGTPSPNFAEDVVDKSPPAVVQETPMARETSETTNCFYCKSKGKPESEWTNHNLKFDHKIVCPDALKTMKCAFCQQVGGEDAHTAGSCPQKKNRQTPCATPRDRSVESTQAGPRETPRLMDRPLGSYEKQYSSGRGGRYMHYRNYESSNNRDGRNYESSNNRDGRNYESANNRDGRNYKSGGEEFRRPRNTTRGAPPRGGYQNQSHDKAGRTGYNFGTRSNPPQN